MSQGMNNAAVDVTSELWTVRKHVASSKVKPVKILELGENERGKFARVEFEDETSRPVYLQDIQDAWHPFFHAFGPDEMWKVRQFFGEKRERQTLPDGSIKSFPYLSYQSEVRTKRGAFVESNLFDVEDATYYEGHLRGYEAAREFLKVLRVQGSYSYVTHPQSLIPNLADCLNDGEDKGFSQPSRRHAAAAFIHMLWVFLERAATDYKIDEFIEKKISELNEREKQAQKEIQESKRQFVERMKKARDAKRLNEAKGKQQAECAA